MDEEEATILNVTGVQIVLAKRTGSTVSVDTWGGSGYAMVPDKWQRAITTYDGNVTMHFDSDAKAMVAAVKLNRWAEENVMVRIACNNRTKQVCITNLQNRTQVANYELN